MLSPLKKEILFDVSRSSEKKRKKRTTREKERKWRVDFVA